MVHRRGLHRVFAVLVVAALGGALVAAPAPAQVSHTSADYGGYATGTVLHADVLEGGLGADVLRLADAEVSMSGASVASKGFTGAIKNEMDRVVQPALSGKSAYGRGSGVEVGLAHAPDADNQVILAGLAEASAAPSSDLVTKEIGPVEADPLLYAAVARGQAQARWSPDSCTLGSDLAYGLGYVADAQLLDTQNLVDASPTDPEGALATLEKALLATDAPNPQRAVAQSTSRLRLVPQVSKDGTVEGPNLGLMSETRMTILPVSLNLSAFNESLPFITIEFLGEWVLRAVATGHSGYVSFTPGTVDTSPSTPVLRVIDQTANKILGELKLQDILGATGLQIPIPELGIEIAVGEAPRAIGGAYGSEPTETATEASGAIDVVRVRLLDNAPVEGLSLADIRLGHMEALAQVPAGGITCNLGVSKSSNPETIDAGTPFVYTITVTNPFDCELVAVKLEDTVTATDGVVFGIGSQTPAASKVEGNHLTWDDIGPIPPKESKSVMLNMTTDAASSAGVITDHAVASAECGLGSAEGGADVQVPVSGEVTLALPNVSPVSVLGVVEGEPEIQTNALPRTGGPALAPLALALAGLGILRRRRRI